jgi:hypothetical protein
MVSMMLCPSDTMQAHVLYVATMHRGACIGLLDSVEVERAHAAKWRVRQDTEVLHHPAPLLPQSRDDVDVRASLAEQLRV